MPKDTIFFCVYFKLLYERAQYRGIFSTIFLCSSRARPVANDGPCQRGIWRYTWAMDNAPQISPALAPSNTAQSNEASPVDAGLGALSDLHLLVVDDDDRIRELLKRYLTKTGFRVSTAANAQAAHDLRRSLRFDLLILDVMMPGEDGFSLTRNIRKTDDVPILLLTARSTSTDRIHGLSIGADDYLPKPFEPEELVLRIKSILKRQSQAPRTQKLQFGPWVYDQDRNLLLRGGKTFHCTTAELSLLRVLSGRHGIAIGRADLCAAISAKSERAVDVQITRLRRKIEPNPATPQFIITVRHKGYKLLAEPILGIG